MATFAKASFNTAKYAAARPTYPHQLFDFVYKYHERSASGKARWDTAVDLGCGTGQATVELTAFKRVIGVDPSAKMIEEAKKYTESLALQANEFDYVHSAAESLPFLEDESVDLVISAQAAHWFDWHKLWPELARVLRKDGSVAFWGYSEFRLTHYPSLTPLIREYSQGKDPANSIGPHWEQPGRSILDNHLLDIPKATETVPGAFYDAEHVFFTGDHHPQLPNPRPIILSKTMSWSGLESWLRSSSSIHTFHNKYPDDLQRPDGDIATRFIRQLKEGMRQIDADHGEVKEDKDEDEVHVEWPVALVLVKRA